MSRIMNIANEPKNLKKNTESLLSSTSAGVCLQLLKTSQECAIWDNNFRSANHNNNSDLNTPEPLPSILMDISLIWDNWVVFCYRDCLLVGVFTVEGVINV